MARHSAVNEEAVNTYLKNRHLTIFKFEAPKALTYNALQ